MGEGQEMTYTDSGQLIHSYTHAHDPSCLTRDHDYLYTNGSSNEAMALIQNGKLESSEMKKYGMNGQSVINYNINLTDTRSMQHSNIEITGLEGYNAQSEGLPRAHAGISYTHAQAQQSGAMEVGGVLPPGLRHQHMHLQTNEGE